MTKTKESLKIQIDKNKLVDALNKVSSVVQPGNTIKPIYGFIKLEIHSQKIEVYASNGKNEISTHFKDEFSNSEFSVCLPFKQLLTLIKGLDDILTLSENSSGRIVIKGEKSTHTLPKMPGEDFVLRDIEFLDKTKMPTQRLSEILSFVDVAVSKIDQANMTLTGVNIAANRENIIFESCDGHKICKVVYPNKQKFEFKSLILGKNVQVINKFLDHKTTESEVTTAFGDNTINFLDQSTVLSIGLLTTAFPNLERLMPPKSLYKIEIDKISLENSLQRAQVTSNNNHSQWLFSEKNLVITTEEKDLGSTIENIEINCPELKDKQPVEINCNITHITDFLKVVKGNPIFEIIDWKSPMKIYSSEDKENLIAGETQIYIAMPVVKREEYDKK